MKKFRIEASIVGTAVACVEASSHKDATAKFLEAIDAGELGEIALSHIRVRGNIACVDLDPPPLTPEPRLLPRESWPCF